MLIKSIIASASKFRNYKIKKDNEILDMLLNNINSNMKNYNEDINAQMNISDDLETKD